MIYMVEMDFPHPERLAEWHAWYLAHIRVLLTVPGFRASQRFEAITATPSPYLALHEVEFAGAVRKRRVPRPRRPGLDRRMARLADQLAPQPARRDRRDPRGAGRQVSGRAARCARRYLPADAPIVWLRGVGLDGTVSECGLAVVGDPAPWPRSRAATSGAALPADQRKDRRRHALTPAQCGNACASDDNFEPPARVRQGDGRGVTDGTVAAHRLPALRHDQPGAARQARPARETAAAAAGNVMRRCSTGIRSRSIRRVSSVIWRKAASRC